MLHPHWPLRTTVVGLALLFMGSAQADGPSDNVAGSIRRIPPLGLEVPAAERAALEEQLAVLAKSISELRKTLEHKPELALLPDVEIYHKAVSFALANQEFHKPEELAIAKRHLETGLARAASLAIGKAPWTHQTGLVARGYRSKIDGSVQPYGLLIPDSYTFPGGSRHRLDIWLQGRAENTNEVVFLDQREKNKGQIQPADAIVLHPYGRFCNANKFAGEIDVLEAMDDVRRQYRIDDARVVMRGFSMGGAACWQFAVHYSDRWVATTPGAGFAETRQFLSVFQKEDASKAPAYQQKLWHWYDSTDYAGNLLNCPVIAYSGEIDPQKQAADLMTKAMQTEGLSLVHLIGPKTGHKITPEAAAEIEKRLTSIVAAGRNPLPARVSLSTWTLRYPSMYWLRIDRMGRHWDKAKIEAEIVDRSTVRIPIVENIDAFTISMPAGLCPLDPRQAPVLLIGTPEQRVSAPPVQSDRSWELHLRRSTEGKWQITNRPWGPELAKRPGLQGPIDDAFMDSFLMVRPSGKPMNPAVGDYLANAYTHATQQWRSQFRGDARDKMDSEITDADMANHNLLLWGDPASNQIIARIADRLPIQWNKDHIVVAGKEYASKDNALAMIFPNPLNPEKYIVLNSGFTYREYDYLNNARQVAKLPDWAVIPISRPISGRSPGDTELPAGFFNENWQVP